MLRQTAVAQHEPLLSESGAPASSESEYEDYPVDVPTISWADHMEYVDELTEEELELCRTVDRLQPGLKPISAPQEDVDVLDIGRMFVRAQSGCCLAHFRQTAFPHDITFVGHDGICDCLSATWTFKDESVSVLHFLSPPVCIASLPEEADLVSNLSTF